MASTGKGKVRVAETDWDNGAGVGGPGGGSTIPSLPSLQPAPPSLPPLAPLPPMLAPLNPRRKRTDTVRGGLANGPAAAAAAGGSGQEYPEDYEVEETDKAGTVHRVRYHYVRPTDTLQGLAIQYGITPEDLRRVNRLWANDSLYLRKTLAIPLALCNDTGPRYAKPTVTAMSINGERLVLNGPDNDAGPSSRSRTTSSASTLSMHRAPGGRYGLLDSPVHSPPTSVHNVYPHAPVPGAVSERTSSAGGSQSSTRQPSPRPVVDTPFGPSSGGVVEDSAGGKWIMNIYGVWQQLRPDSARLEQHRQRMEEIENDLYEL